MLFLSSIVVFSSCSKDDKKDLPNPPPEEEEDNSKYEWEKNRTSLLVNNDMVLLYASGAQRKHQWNEEYVEPYVTYKDESGKEHWLFDSFLFLEIHNGKGKEFANGYTGDPANQQEWKNLIDHYFQSRYCIGALNRTIESAKKRIGEPSQKRKIMIGIPEPVQTQKDWGSVKNGVPLNFSKPNDRVSAVKWYIDYARKKFKETDYKNVELAGFYWLPERATHSRSILADISSYLNDLKYTFEWIPYQYADGAFEWKILTFNYAYYQPNYFFNKDRPITLLNQTCEAAIKYDMGVEIEFDERALVGNGDWGYRLEDYMRVFKEYGVWKTKRIGYYQGDNALYQLSKSTEKADQLLYHKFCKFVTERPK